MPNPFPGVNPFIEATGDLWVGFHNVLISQMSILLNASLMPRGYAAFVDKRIELVSTSDENNDRHRQPDVAVSLSDYDSLPRLSGGAAAAVLDVEPAAVKNPSYDSVPVAFIEVRSLPDQELVTGIELLSPSNKSGSGRAEYAAKRAALLAGGVNLVEIDLLLGGRRPDVVGKVPAGDFFAFVSRGNRRPLCEVYAWSIRRTLPRLPIPLRPGDADATLDLAMAYAMTYDGGPYPLVLPYDRPLAGTLSDADAGWLAEHRNRK